MSQTDQILGHLKRRPITPLEALELYGCFRLAARVSDLRGMGWPIETEMVQGEEKRWAQYYLPKGAKI